MLMDSITVDNIDIQIQATDWEDAITKSAQTLLNQGAFTPEYIDAMIKVVKDSGPYIVISKHIALAHARPENGVIKQGLSFSTLNPPIEFGAEGLDPVRLVITLAAKDNNAHLDLLAELVDVLMDEDRMEALYEAKTKEEFLGILKG